MNHNLAVNYTPDTDYGQELRVMDKPIEWVETDVAAAIMETSRANVTYLCRTGKIRCEKFSGVWKVSKQDAEAYIRRAKDGRNEGD